MTDDAENNERPVAPDRPEPVSARSPSWLIPVALYAFAATVLLLVIRAGPVQPDNWEGYTAWRYHNAWDPVPDPFRIFALTDGLMTDSGRGPLVGVPVWIASNLAGFGLVPFRIGVALVAATAVPLLWFCGQKLSSPFVALFAALLLAISPVWLWYGQIATLVGVSLVPLLLGVLALIATLEAPAARAPWRALWLGLALIAGEYAYAPVRLLWPSAVAVLAAAAWRRPDARIALIKATLIAACSVPLALVTIGWMTTDPRDPGALVEGYFRARGEQVLELDAADYDAYIRRENGPPPALDRAGPLSLMATLVWQNTRDLFGLLADRGTLPTRADHWNERGRLWVWPFGVLLGVGVFTSGWRALRRRNWRSGLLLLLVAGLTLPLLLSTRVHVGRLVPALPFLLMLAADGVWVLSVFAAGLAAGERPNVLQRAIPSLIAGGVLAVASFSALTEQRVSPPPSRQRNEAMALGALAPDAMESGLTVVVDPASGADIERVHAATWRLLLDRDYEFVDLGTLVEPSRLNRGRSSGTGRPSFSAGPDTPSAATSETGANIGLGAADPRQADSGAPDAARRPVLRYGEALSRLESGSLPNPCATRYAVAAGLEERVQAALTLQGCPTPPSVFVLPD